MVNIEINMFRPKKIDVIRLVAVCFVTGIIVTNELLPRRSVLHRPRIFHRTRHGFEIFPPGAPLMDVVHLPFIIANHNICAKTHHVIIVHSAAGNFERRRNYRETWANPEVLSSFQAKVVFIVGLPRDNQVQRNVINENKLYQDIVQGNFFDDYTNLTLKAVTGLRWVAENCLKATTVFKIDDDVFLDIYKAMYEIVPLLEFRPRQLICSAEPTAWIFRKGDLEKLNKWKVSDNYFPGLRKYPMPFCYGFGVFMSSEVARELFELSKSTPFYRLDDVFVYGILANNVKGLFWRSEDDLFTQDPDVTLDVFRQQITNSFLLGTVRSREATLELWNLAKQLHDGENIRSEEELDTDL